MHWLGEFAPSAAHMQRVLDMDSFEVQNSVAPGSLYDMRIVALIYQSLSMCIQGCPEQAVVRSERALMLGRTTRHPQSLAFALSMAALLTLVRRAENEAPSLLEELSSLAADQRLPFWLAVASILLGYTLSGSGRLAEGFPLARKGFADCVATGSKISHTAFLALISQIHARAGDPDVARGLLATAMEQADRSGERWFEAELHRLAGEWLITFRPEDEAGAQACLLRALALAHKQNARWWELRTATSLARLWRRQDQPSRARALLEPLYTRFTEGLDLPDLRDARTLLDMLG